MKRTVIKISTILFSALLFSSANACGNQYQLCMPTFPYYSCNPCNHWYIGGDIGVSRTHDKPAPNSGDSMTQIGPGWSVYGGYQVACVYNTMFGGELGYIQYHNSTENTVGTNVANTEHFSAYAAAVGKYRFYCNFSVIGKAGVAYSYAKKVFVGGGASASANTYSPYYGLGVGYQASPKVAFVLEWSRVRGNSGSRSTGSTDLSSLGVTYSFG